MAGDNYVEQIEDVLRHSVAKKGVAGFFAESIQGALLSNIAAILCLIVYLDVHSKWRRKHA